ncbi:MAG: hypothetical protein ACI9SC_003263, partial [Gammaproteobacteria bacterium]
MKKESKYPAPTFLQYHDYPESGNKRNGLGETSYRRPNYV